MRTIGFVLVLLGVVTIYLAVQGKIGAAVSALITGQVPSMNQNSGGDTAAGKGKLPKDSPSVGGGGYQTPPTGPGSIIVGGSV